MMQLGSPAGHEGWGRERGACCPVVWVSLVLGHLARAQRSTEGAEKQQLAPDRPTAAVPCAAPAACFSMCGQSIRWLTLSRSSTSPVWWVGVEVGALSRLLAGAGQGPSFQQQR